MESNEEYLLSALRRTSGGLSDSLIPAHGAKLTKLLDRFESADSITQEVRTLLHVQGFGKCSLAMEWLLERTKRSQEYHAPEQFESDVLLLNEKLFEAFLNQPFDMPDFSRTFEAPVNPVQENVHFTQDDFSESKYSSHENIFSERSVESEQKQESITEPDWSTTSSITSFDSMLSDSSASSQQNDSSPSLVTAMNADLYDASERISQTSIEFFDKQPGERPISMAVLRVTVRAALDTAQTSGNLVAQDFCEAYLRVIAYADEQGKIKTDAFADAIRDIGDRLSFALKQSSGGITLLSNLTKYIKDPKDLFRN